MEKLGEWGEMKGRRDGREKGGGTCSKVLRGIDAPGGRQATLDVVSIILYSTRHTGVLPEFHFRPPS